MQSKIFSEIFVEFFTIKTIFIYIYFYIFFSVECTAFRNTARKVMDFELMDLEKWGQQLFLKFDKLSFIKRSIYMQFLTECQYI